MGRIAGGGLLAANKHLGMQTFNARVNNSKVNGKPHEKAASVSWQEL